MSLVTVKYIRVANKAGVSLQVNFHIDGKSGEMLVTINPMDRKTEGGIILPPNGEVIPGMAAISLNKRVNP